MFAYPKPLSASCSLQQGHHHSGKMLTWTAPAREITASKKPPGLVAGLERASAHEAQPQRFTEWHQHLPSAVPPCLNPAALSWKHSTPRHSPPRRVGSSSAGFEVPQLGRCPCCSLQGNARSLLLILILIWVITGHSFSIILHQVTSSQLAELNKSPSAEHQKC